MGPGVLNTQLIPALGRLRQEDGEVETKSCPQTKLLLSENKIKCKRVMMEMHDFCWPYMFRGQIRSSVQMLTIGFQLLTALSVVTCCLQC